MGARAAAGTVALRSPQPPSVCAWACCAQGWVAPIHQSDVRLVCACAQLCACAPMHGRGGCGGQRTGPACTHSTHPRTGPACTPTHPPCAPVFLRSARGFWECGHCFGSVDKWAAGLREHRCRAPPCLCVWGSSQQRASMHRFVGQQPKAVGHRAYRPGYVQQVRVRLHACALVCHRSSSRQHTHADCSKQTAAAAAAHCSAPAALEGSATPASGKRTPSCFCLCSWRTSPRAAAQPSARSRPSCRPLRTHRWGSCGRCCLVQVCVLAPVQLLSASAQACTPPKRSKPTRAICTVARLCV